MDLDWYLITFHWKHLFITGTASAFVCVPQLPPLKEIGNLSNLGGHTCQLHGGLKVVSLGRLEIDRKQGC